MLSARSSLAQTLEVSGRIAPAAAVLSRDLPVAVDRVGAAGGVPVTVEGVTTPSGDWSVHALRFPLRKYQALALDAFDAARSKGVRRTWLVLPPGAGKTITGLEAARRLGRRTLVLAPNTAVQAQWAKQWELFEPLTAQAPAVEAGVDRDLLADLNVLTYQSLAVFDRDEEVSVSRTKVVRSGSTEDLLGLLHPNGRALVERAAASGPWTLVLDECHHLLEAWGALVRALIETLGDETFVVGLTATPPSEMSGWQAALQHDLFGPTTFSVPLPAVVKEGDLAPYQELAYLTAPTAEEDLYISSERMRWSQLQLDLAGTGGPVGLFPWLERRIVERRTVEGAEVSWREFERSEPEFARAGLRFALAGLLPLPEGATIREEHRQDPDSEDWVAVLEDFCLHRLVPSKAPEDERLLAAVKRALPSLGYRLTAKGVTPTTSPVDRVCALSSSKAAAAAHILEVEASGLGEGLRALVLCDFELEPAELPAALKDSSLSTRSGSARLVLLTLASSSVAEESGGLLPVLLTGRTVACDVDLAPALIEHCVGLDPSLEGLDAAPLEPGSRLVVLQGPSSWRSRVYCPLVTSFFVAGGANVLVGTRSLLGEGWDCPAVNVLVDLTSAATATAVTQIRGRSLRLDPRDADKVANNWSVACVTDHPKGDADYLRMVRKHQHHFAPNSEGVIESGVTHSHPGLSPYGPPAGPGLRDATAASLERALDRSGARERWGIGEPYFGHEVSTIRIRAERPLGLSPEVVPTARISAPRGSGVSRRPSGWRRRGWGASASTALGSVTFDDPALGAGVGLGAAVAVVSALGFHELARVRTALPSGALEHIAAALADGLHGCDATSRGADAVSLAPSQDGWVRASLEGCPEPESALYAACLDELLAPLSEPKHMVGRLVVPPPLTASARRSLAVRRALGRPVEASLTWHAVPSFFSNQRRRRAFLSAWEEHLGAAPTLSAKSPEGLAVLDLERGADPFGVSSQLRTQWR